MAATIGYQGYGDPDRVRLDRQRQLAELLQTRALDAGPKSLGEGIAQLGTALLARNEMNQADAAETTYADNRKKMAGTLISTMYPDAKTSTQTELSGSQAFDLTPRGIENRSVANNMTSATGDKVKALAAYLGDPVQAMQTVEAMKPKGQFLQGPDGAVSWGNPDSGAVRQIQPGRPEPKKPIEVGDVLLDPDTYEPLYTAPEKPVAPNLPDGWQMGENGPEAIPGYAEWYSKLHPDRGRSSGDQPPSGYRWKQDGSLERIPGGPADKPSAPAYDAPTARKYLSQAQTLDSLDGAINQYMALIEKHGPQIQTSGLQGDNKIAAQLDAARTAIDIQTKELFNLGVLNGPDLDIIRGAIPDVTGFEAWGKTGDSVGASMNVLRDYISRGRNQIPPEIIARARPNGAQAEPKSQGGGALFDPLQATGQAMQQSIQEGMRQALTRDDGKDDNMDGFIDGLFPADDGTTDEIPEGITAEEWNAMPPEDRALFQ